MAKQTLYEKLRGQIGPVTLYHCQDCNEYYNSYGDVVDIESYEDWEKEDLLTIEEKQCYDCKAFYLTEDSKY